MTLSPEDLLQLMKARRSIRQYTDQPVPEATVRRLLEAAIWSPSAHNRQPWRWVVIRSDEEKRRLAEAMAAQLRVDLQADGTGEDIIAADIERSQRRLTGASVLILVCLSMVDMDTYPDVRRQEHEHTMAAQSTAMAAQNLLLMAQAEGMGACWMCGPLFCQDVVRQTLNLPADYEPQGVIGLGYPAQTRQKTRHPLGSRVIFR